MNNKNPRKRDFSTEVTSNTGCLKYDAFTYKKKRDFCDSGKRTLNNDGHLGTFNCIKLSIYIFLQDF